MKIKRLLSIVCCIILCSTFVVSLHAEEGMIPLSEIHKLDLAALGFDLAVKDLYNPSGVSLVDGIINLSGCTASFVSPEGLILTNYHCAFRAIQSVTTKEEDYMKEGFIASDRTKEVQAKGYTVRLIEFYEDVSKDVLKVVKKKMTYEQRTKAIQKQIKKIVVKTEKEYEGRRAEVAEMFQGKTYVLFVYTYLKDIRLVYAPPRSIGEYGGEEDNWMWPRHTGDFTFMRAYVAPDGSPADYSEKNVPFKPKKHLQVAPEGVTAEDFVFILGYPGRTYRHRTSHYYAYESEIRKPKTADLFHWMIEVLERVSKRDRTTEIKLAPTLKGLWNAMKSYRGQLKSFKALNLTDIKRKEEEALQAFIDKDQKRKEKYGDLLSKIGDVYQEIRKDAEYDLTIRYLRRASMLLNNAYTVYSASIERKKKDTERDYAYMDRNFDRTKKRMAMGLRNYCQESDQILLKELMTRLSKLEAIKANKELAPFVGSAEAIDAFIDSAYKSSKLMENDYLMPLFEKSTKELEKMDAPFMKLAIALYPLYKKQEAKLDSQKGILDNLQAQLLNVKMAFEGKDFIPDANSTLRLTYGHIRGYSPRDAVYYKPFTTLTGVVEKNTDKYPFIATEKLKTLYKNKELGSFIHPVLKDVPTCILYDTDTTGGNSGSPVLNAKGQLIGLNFDRVYEATINDFAWDKSYSRSIGVDIRYILWFLEKYGNAHHLLKEMKLK